MAAREVAVAAIGTVYAVEDAGGEAGQRTIRDNLKSRWSLPTALAFLVWFVFAPQCISTIAVARRETNGWRWPAFMVGYLFLIAHNIRWNNLLVRGRAAGGVPTMEVLLTLEQQRLPTTAREPDGFLTVSDFLNTYAVSRTGFYREVSRGNIRLVKIGRSSRIARADAQRWAASLPIVGGEA